MQLSLRLEKIMSMTTQSGAVADIGTDHGYVPVELVRRGKFQKAFAMDIRKGPLERAKEHIEKAGLKSQIETRLSNGLEHLAPGEADTIVIAGMGGPLMSDILSAGMETVRSAKELILSPQSEVGDFHRYLMENSLKVEEEYYLEDENKFYVVIRCTNGIGESWDDTELRYGKQPLEEKSPVLKKLLEKEIRTASSILQGLEKTDTEAARARAMEVRRDLEAAHEAMKRLIPEA